MSGFRCIFPWRLLFVFRALVVIEGEEEEEEGEGEAEGEGGEEEEEEGDANPNLLEDWDGEDKTEVTGDDDVGGGGGGGGCTLVVKPVVLDGLPLEDDDLEDINTSLLCGPVHYYNGFSISS